MDLMSSSADLLSQLEMEEAALLIHEYDWQVEMMRPFEPHQRHSSSLQDTHGGNCKKRAAEQQPKRDSSSSSSSFLTYESGSRVISFGSPSFPQYGDNGCTMTVKPKQEVSDHVDFMQVSTATKSATRRSGGSDGGGGGGAFSNIEHVAAERKRREKLTQKFVLLSSLLPCLKKLDKASVLAEAASYVKQLQEQVKTLEEQASKREEELKQESRTMMSSSRQLDEDFLVKDTNSSSSSNENNVNNSPGDALPEIQARFSGRDVMIKLHCERKQGILPKVLDEIQKLHLHVINSNAMAFGKYAMDITVLAQMNDDFSTAEKDLVKLLRRSFQVL